MTFIKRLLQKDKAKRLSSPNSSERLTLKLNELLEYYQTQIEAKWTLKNEDWGDASNICGTRDEIHKLIVDTKNTNHTFNSQLINKIKKLDHDWQEWLEKRLKVDLSENQQLLNHKAPKEQWWWWIDCLDELTEEEKSTL